MRVTTTDACFLFQAEDGIRDIGVTGVQTCALPILGQAFQFLPTMDRYGTRGAQENAGEQGDNPCRQKARMPAYPLVNALLAGRLGQMRQGAMSVLTLQIVVQVPGRLI